MRHCTASPPIIAGPGLRPVAIFSSHCPAPLRPGIRSRSSPISVTNSSTTSSVTVGLIESVSVEIADLDAVLADPVTPEIAYCSPEFGIDALVPQYAGGLGVLAGDHLKAASDRRLPLAGVGLFYRHGYFDQEIADGGQAEHYPTVDPLQLGAEDTGVVVSVPLPGRRRRSPGCGGSMWVGIPLLVLDTNIEANSEHDRGITDRLYGGDRHHRLDQEMVLGVGGARALAALGWTDPGASSQRGTCRLHRPRVDRPGDRRW